MLSGSSLAQSETDIAGMDLADLADVRITSATGIPQPISQAPAVATVITAEEIEAMGALSLDEVLETVAGLHVVPSKVRRMDPIYSIRGIHSGQNSQVLTLLDGVPVHQGFAGGPAFGFRLPLAAIERIEIVRGPGSAVFGADAFAGVVNIVTRAPADEARLDGGLRAGSFGTSNAWISGTGAAYGWDAVGTVEWLGSDGDDGRIVEADLQTTLDPLFGTDASHAPGPLRTPDRIVNVNLGLRRKSWTLRWWGYRNGDSGNGAGFANALDPTGHETATQSLLTAETQQKVGEHWDLSGRFAYGRLEQHGSSRLFPAGAVLPIGSDGNVDFLSPAGLVRFPDGLIAQPGVTENNFSGETVGVFRGFARHQVRLALGAQRVEARVEQKANFGPGVIDGSQPVVDGDLTDLTGTPYIFLPAQNRDQWFVSVQDQWSILRDLQVTAGLRYDEYSDFGGTLNPRVAVVWATRPTVTTKLLYGSAFRAPTFAELHVVNNPSRLGNPDLQPETIDTLELAVDYRPSGRLRTALSLFTYRGKDLIELVPDPGARTLTAQNFRTQEGYGSELEIEANLSSALHLHGSFAWQRSEDVRTGARPADAPGSQLSLGAEWRPRPSWAIRPELRHVADRAREVGDPRPRVEDYTLVDLVVRYVEPTRAWSVGLIGRNLFDTDAREPAGPEIPGDFPLPGRSLVLELRGRL